MSPEAQRIAIAKACGKEVPCGGSEPERIEVHKFGDWNMQNKPVPFLYRKCVNCGAIHIRGEHNTQIERDDELPDYLNDLNAMQEAEKTLSTKEPFWESEKFRYAYILGEIMWSLDDPPDFNCEISKCGWAGMHEVSLILSATAAQRAEAFLRALNLWKEEEVAV